MHLKNFLSSFGRLKAENRLLKFAVVVIGVVVLINTAMLQRAINSQRTILIPPGLDKKVEITGDQVDDQYVTQFSRYVAGLALTFNHGNVKKQFEELLLLFAADAFPSGKTTFYNLAQKVIQARMAQVFQVEKIKIDAATKRIEVFGMRSQFIDEKKLDSKPMTYIFEYRVANGRFLLVSILEADRTGRTSDSAVPKEEFK